MAVQQCDTAMARLYNPLSLGLTQFPCQDSLIMAHSILLGVIRRTILMVSVTCLLMLKLWCSHHSKGIPQLKPAGNCQTWSLALVLFDIHIDVSPILGLLTDPAGTTKATTCGALVFSICHYCDLRVFRLTLSHTGWLITGVPSTSGNRLMPQLTCIRPGKWAWRSCLWSLPCFFDSAHSCITKAFQGIFSRV